MTFPVTIARVVAKYTKRWCVFWITLWIGVACVVIVIMKKVPVARRFIVSAENKLRPVCLSVLSLMEFLTGWAPQPRPDTPEVSHRTDDQLTRPAEGAIQAEPPLPAVVKVAEPFTPLQGADRYLRLDVVDGTTDAPSTMDVSIVAFVLMAGVRQRTAERVIALAGRQVRMTCASVALASPAFAPLPVYAAVFDSVANFAASLKSPCVRSAIVIVQRPPAGRWSLDSNADRPPSLLGVERRTGGADVYVAEVADDGGRIENLLSLQLGYKGESGVFSNTSALPPSWFSFIAVPK